MTESPNNNSDFFNPNHLRRTIREISINNGFINLFTQGALFIITMTRAAILARLLSPSDYGVIGMATVLISFALIFKDLGLSTATIREKHLTHCQISNLFWINTFIAIISMLIVIGSAPIITWFFNDQRLLNITLILSISFLLGGLSVQHQALLKRKMQFRKISIVTIVANILSSIIGIVLAVTDSGYWSLVWMQVSLNFFILLGLYFITQWTPSLPSKNVGTKRLLKIGLDVAGLNAFATITKQLDRIIIGRITNAETLGLYGRGLVIPNLVSGPVRMSLFSVALPALSTLQNDPKRFTNYYYKFLNLTCWATMPLAVFFFIFADAIINIFLGDQWQSAVFFLQIATIRALIMPAITTLDQIPLALGFSKHYLYGGMVRTLCTTLCVVWGAMTYGITGIAVAAASADLISFIPFFMICSQKSQVKLLDFIKYSITPFSVSIITGLAVIFLKTRQYSTGIPIEFILIAAYLVTIVIFFLLSDFFHLGSQTGLTQQLLNHRITRLLITKFKGLR